MIEIYPMTKNHLFLKYIKYIYFGELSKKIYFIAY